MTAWAGGKLLGTIRSTGSARAQMMAFCKLFTDAPVDSKRTLLAGVSSKKLFAELHCWHLPHL
jgi:hypothetical protein